MTAISFPLSRFYSQTSPFTYFILTLLNFRPASFFCKPTQLFVQVYITFHGLKFKLEMMSIMLQMTNIITVSREEKEKGLSHF